ncbi:MAG: PEP-utilizing enzyme [Patescibacteria group bacterium]
MSKRYFIFNSEPGVDILSLNPIVRAIISKELAIFVGKGIPRIAYEFSEGIVRAMVLKKEWHDWGEFVYNRLITEPGFDRSIVKNSEKYVGKIYDIAKKTLKNLEEHKIDDLKRKKVIKVFFNLYFELCVYGITGAIIELGSARSSQDLKKLIKSKIEDKRQINEYLSILGFIDVETYDQKVHEDLAKIAQEIYSNELEMNNLPLKIVRKVERHVAKWAWVTYGYTGPEYSLTGAYDSLITMLSSDIPPLKQIQIMKKQSQVKKEQRDGIIKHLKLSDSEMRIIKVAENISYVKIIRTPMMFLSNYVIHKLMEPFLKKEGITMKQAGMMTMREMYHYMDAGEFPNINILNRRWKYCVLFDSEEGESFLYNSEAKQWVENNVVKEEISNNGRELSGQVACADKRDKIRGVVKIVNGPEEMVKFNQEDILVSIATTPDIVPAMKKAKAIISDIGGMTCHAAVVSRELGVPCIVGTKFASRFFKDGEEVEMDMLEGIIKKI